MNLFNTKKTGEYTIIIGCGRLGANIANTLSDAGKNVLIMDKQKEAFRRLSSGFGGLSVVADGTDFNALREADIQNATAVVVVTNKDNTNIMAAQIAKHVFKAKLVIARLYDYERECVYKEFGIDTICPAVLSANEIDKILTEFKQKKDMGE